MYDSALRQITGFSNVLWVSLVTSHIIYWPKMDAAHNLHLISHLWLCWCIKTIPYYSVILIFTDLRQTDLVHELCVCVRVCTLFAGAAGVWFGLHGHSSRGCGKRIVLIANF